MAFSIRISGTVLSSLLYECANSPTDIEGYFIGALSSRTTLASDDSNDLAFEKREDFILIHGYQIASKTPYDYLGNLIKEHVTSHTSDLTSLVGYFKFRRQSDVTLSVRDQIFMQSWSKSIPHGCISILSSSLNSIEDKSTQSYEFAFWDMKSGSKLAMDISNMNDSTLLYKQFMSNVPYKVLQPSSVTIDHLPSSTTITDPYDKMYEASIESLRKATTKVITKEAELRQLQQDIEELETKKRIVFSP